MLVMQEEKLSVTDLSWMKFAKSFFKKKKKRKTHTILSNKKNSAHKPWLKFILNLGPKTFVSHNDTSTSFGRKMSDPDLPMWCWHMLVPHRFMFLYITKCSTHNTSRIKMIYTSFWRAHIKYKHIKNSIWMFVTCVEDTSSMLSLIQYDLIYKKKIQNL